MIAPRNLYATACKVEVDYTTLDRALQVYFRDTAACILKGDDTRTNSVISITVDDTHTRVEIASVVIARSQVRRVALGRSRLWPLNNDPDHQVASFYYVCERAANGMWSTRPFQYSYKGDDRGIDWFDLLVDA